MRRVSAESYSDRRSAPTYVGRDSASACTMSAAVLTPVSTSMLGSPAALAPAMSVSRRSPITNGLRNSPRASASFISDGAGLPATCGSLIGRRAQRGDHRAVSGQQATLGRQGAIHVGRHPQGTGADGERGLCQIGPTRLRRVPLHDGHRIVGALPDGAQADVADLGGERLRADDENR